MTFTFRPVAQISTNMFPGDVSRRGEYSYVRRQLLPDTPRWVVDVGALAKKQSNSWNFIKDGWKGILVEPQPGPAQLCRERFQGNFTVVEKAIADYEGKATLYRYKTAGWASLDQSLALKHAKRLRMQHPQPITPIEVEVTTLPKLLEEHAVPHRFGVLSIDAEGCDQAALEPMLKSPWRPDFILIETCDPQVIADAGYDHLLLQADQQIWVRREVATS